MFLFVFFVCRSNISGTAERISAKFRGKTCLFPRSDEFKCQGQRSQLSKVNVTRDKNALSAVVTPGSVRMVCARCKQRAAAADGTILYLPGVISGACVRCMFGKTSLALVMVALRNRADHYIIFILWFLSICLSVCLSIYLSICFFSSPNLSRRRLDVCHTSTHGVVLVRI